VQDCGTGYGVAVGLAEVTRIDDGGFRQVVRQVLRPGAQWPGRRLHTLNASLGLECIDGSALSPRSETLARLLEPWCLRRSLDEHVAAAPQTVRRTQTTGGR
jgi:hypothetical protein